MDTLVLPDIKPDIKPDVESLEKNNTEESFAIRITKGSKWILIDEYPKPKPPGHIKSNPTISATPPPDLETIHLQNQANKIITEHHTG